jgi:peptidyl-prolyl cis-trans isomerase SurA
MDKDKENEMKQLLLIPALLCGFYTAEAKIVDRIVAQVNDDIITLSDLNRKLEEYRQIYSKEEQAQMAPNMEKKALQELVENKLLDQKAAEFGPPSDLETSVSAQIQEVMKSRNIKTQEDLEKVLAQQGMNLRDLRDTIRKQIMRDDLINSYVRSRITLLSEEVDKFYKDHVVDYSTPEEVAFSEIDIPIEGNGQEAETRAADIYNRLLKGESFAVLASQYSKGPAASKGGSAGVIQLLKLNNDYRQAIAGLNDGDISKPQKIKNFLAIIRMDARKPVTVRPLSEVSNDIKRRLWEQKYTPEYDRFITQLKENAYIQYFTEME